MMRRIVLLFTVLVLGGVAMAQQSESRFDVFGGYSYFNGSTSGAAGRFGLNGWNAQGTYNFTGWLGATADFGGYYGSPFGASTHDYSFLFGPTLSLRVPHVTPFVHALFGVDQLHVKVVGGSGTDTAFASAVGWRRGHPD